MKRNYIAIFCMGLAALSAGGQGRSDKGVYTYELMKCGPFMENKDNAYVKHSVSSYARGFMSAANYMRSDGKQVSDDLPDSTVVLYMEKFCRENPLLDVRTGIILLMRDLSK